MNQKDLYRQLAELMQARVERVGATVGPLPDCKDLDQKIRVLLEELSKLRASY